MPVSQDVSTQLLVGASGLTLGTLLITFLLGGRPESIRLGPLEVRFRPSDRKDVPRDDPPDNED